jgi:hypothetical protein
VISRGSGAVRLAVAGLEIAFQSSEPEPLDLLHATSTLPPGFRASGSSDPELTVDLRATGALAYRAVSATRAAAEVSLDPHCLGGHLSAICRAALSQAAGERGGALLHGAAAVLESRAVLLIAPSEGGKTTLCGRLGKAGVPVLSDETIVLRRRPGEQAFDVHGTFFWSGPVLRTLGGAWPVRAVALLQKGPLRAERVSPASALASFLPEWHVDHDASAASRALATAAEVLESAPAYRLSFDRNDSPRSLRELLQSWTAA